MWFSDNIFLLLFFSALLHIADEFVYPGGFAEKFKNLISRTGLAINNFQIVFINILFLSFCLFVLIYGKSFPVIGMSAVMLVMLNGFAHLFISLKHHEFFPGVITGTLLYIPLGLLSLIFFPLHINGKLISLFLAVIFHMIPFIVIIANKNFLNNIKILKTFKSSFYFITALRIILAFSFIFPSIPKLTGKSFTVLSTDSPVGFFFECLKGSGIYWQFLGVMQFLTGLFLIIPRFNTLGAILFTGIILNIFIITVSLPFYGTPYITFLMLCAGILLLLWDYNKIKCIFSNSN